jgi:hypothetical protein
MAFLRVLFDLSKRFSFSAGSGPGVFIYSPCTSRTPMMSFHVFVRRLSALAFSRFPICGPKRLIGMFYLTSRSTSEDPLRQCMCILTRRTSHIVTISRHVSFCFSVDQEIAMWSKTAVLCNFHTTWKHLLRSAKSWYDYSFQPHVPHIDNVKSFPRGLK